MNSNGCLNKILDMLNYEQVDECDKKGLLRTIKQDLDRLEQLEKENQELKEENEFLETNIEEIEASNDRLVDKFLELEKIYLGLVKEYTKLDQVINILKDKIEFEDLGEMQSGNVYRGYFNDCLDEEEVNSIKEVFGNDK